MKKKAFMEPMKTLAIGLAMIAIILAIGFLILAQLKQQINVADGGTSDLSTVLKNSTAYNATNEMIRSVATIPGWLSILVVVFIGAIMIGAVMYFGKNRM